MTAGVTDAEIQIIGNVVAKPIQSAADLCNDIQSQMQSRVRWTETIQVLMRQGITTFVEVGTGNVLLGIDPSNQFIGNWLFTWQSFRFCGA